MPDSPETVRRLQSDKGRTDNQHLFSTSPSPRSSPRTPKPRVTSLKLYMESPEVTGIDPPDSDSKTRTTTAGQIDLRKAQREEEQRVSSIKTGSSLRRTSSAYWGDSHVAKKQRLDAEKDDIEEVGSAKGGLAGVGRDVRKAVTGDRFRNRRSKGTGNGKGGSRLSAVQSEADNEVIEVLSGDSDASAPARPTQKRPTAPGTISAGKGTPKSEKHRVGVPIPVPYSESEPSSSQESAKTPKRSNRSQSKSTASGSTSNQKPDSQSSRVQKFSSDAKRAGIPAGATTRSKPARDFGISGSGSSESVNKRKSTEGKGWQSYGQMLPAAGKVEKKNAPIMAVPDYTIFQTTRRPISSKGVTQMQAPAIKNADSKRSSTVPAFSTHAEKQTASKSPSRKRSAPISAEPGFMQLSPPRNRKKKSDSTSQSAQLPTLSTTIIPKPLPSTSPSTSLTANSKPAPPANHSRRKLNPPKTTTISSSSPSHRPPAFLRKLSPPRHIPTRGNTSIRYLDDDGEDAFMGSSQVSDSGAGGGDTLTHCPQCGAPLPNPLPAQLSKAAKRLPTTTSAYLSCSQSTALFEFCKLHNLVLNVIPEGVRRGWPLAVDFRDVERRCRGMVGVLRGLVEGRVGSEWRERCVEEYRRFGVRRAQGVEKGATTLLRTLSRLFLHPQHPILTPQLAHPQPVMEYMQDVLVPECAVRLVMEDLGVGYVEARKVLGERREFGEGVFGGEAREGSAGLGEEVGGVGDGEVVVVDEGGGEADEWRTQPIWVGSEDEEEVVRWSQRSLESCGAGEGEGKGGGVEEVGAFGTGTEVIGVDADVDVDSDVMRSSPPVFYVEDGDGEIRDDGNVDDVEELPPPLSQEWRVDEVGDYPVLSQESGVSLDSRVGGGTGGGEEGAEEGGEYYMDDLWDQVHGEQLEEESAGVEVYGGLEEFDGPTFGIYDGYEEIEFEMRAVG
ncbi:hypothetical protein HDV00_007012 [Rhizophlyctis rosea]|nr:hypothetical protein HDV00_007012 [Rhizophlyctis rosea]